MFVTRENLADVCYALRGAPELGLDTETTGTFQTDRIFSLIISSPSESYYFNFQDYGDPAYPSLDRAFTFEELRPILEAPHVTWFIHNAKFDMRMLAHEGITLRGQVHCTYAVERVLRNNYFGGNAYKLEGLAKRRGWAKDDAAKTYADKNKIFKLVKIPGKKKVAKLYHFEKVPPEIMVPYGGHDARLHFDIGVDQLTALAKIDAAGILPNGARTYPEQTRVLANELKLTKTLYRMEERGVLIDRDYAANALAYEEGMILQAQKEFQEHTGHPYQDSRKLFVDVFTKAGEKFPLTEEGNPSFAAEVLEEMTSPVASIINRIRGHAKKAGTYYSSFLFFATPENVIHASANQAGTESGRMSYRDPNLQNVPKEDEEDDFKRPYLVRGCFIPRPGYVFHSIDYKTMEYACFVDYAGETRVISEMLQGKDFHQAIADVVGIPRKKAKTLNFMLGYGAGAAKVAATMEISLREAENLIADYWGALPRVQRMMKDVRDAGRARGFIFNAFGRRNYLADRNHAYILPNHLIQGTCADVVKTAMNRIEDFLTEKKAETRMLLQVHDELLIETKIGEEDLIPRIREIMSEAYTPRNGMVLSTSVEHSLKSWSARDKVKGIYGEKN